MREREKRWRRGGGEGEEEVVGEWLCMGTLCNCRTDFTSYLWQLHDSPCRTHAAGSARKTRTGAEEREALTEHNNTLNGHCTSGNP